MEHVASQLFRDAPSLLLLFYPTNVMGIAPAIAGMAIFVPEVSLERSVIFGSASHQIGSPLWVMVSKLIGKKHTYVIAATGHGLVTLAWGLMPDVPMPMAYAMAACWWWGIPIGTMRLWSRC